MYPGVIRTTGIIPEKRIILFFTAAIINSNCGWPGSSSTSIFEKDRTVIAIRKHVGADNALAGGGVGVGIYEAAQLGIVVAGLEVIEPGVSTFKCPRRPF